MTSEEIPKDLGIKLGTKLERFWTTVKDEAVKELEAAEHAVLYQKAVVSIAEINILKEKDYWEKTKKK